MAHPTQNRPMYKPSIPPSTRRLRLRWPHPHFRGRRTIPMITRLIHKIRPRLWAYGLFWSWNLIFLGFMLLGFAPTVLPDMMGAIRSGAIPLVFPLFALVLSLIPLVAVILGGTILRRSPDRLFALGYGIEGPLMLLLAIRFFVVGEVTPAITLLMTVAGLGLLTFLWQLLDRQIDSRGLLVTHLRA